MIPQKVFGKTKEPITNVVGAYSKTLTTFGDDGKIARAWRILSRDDDELIQTWFNTFEPKDKSEPAFVGEQVDFYVCSMAIDDKQKFINRIRRSGYVEIPQEEWPPQCQKTNEI